MRSQAFLRKAIPGLTDSFYNVGTDNRRRHFRECSRDSRDDKRVHQGRCNKTRLLTPFSHGVQRRYD